MQGRSRERATVNDLYMALAHTVRDRLVERWIQTVKNYQAQDVRVVCYLSAEFLTGPHLANNLINLGIYDEAEQAMRKLGLDLETLIEQEEEPGLGNGGLGRLASCFMDSLATLDIPAIGYGIRYEYGIFDQQIRDGWQVESTDKWLRLGNPWALERPEDAFEVKMGGRTERHTDANGPRARAAGFRRGWCAAFRTTRRSSATAPTPPTPCACGRRRPWRASTSRPSTRRLLRRGRRQGVVARISPRFSIPTTKAFRASSCAWRSSSSSSPARLQHILKIQTTQHRPLAELHRNFAIQMNDTHPAIAVAELMRLLMDEHAMEWDTAWHVTHARALLHQPHAAARGAGAVAAQASSARCCRGIWRLSTRSTAAISTMCARSFPATKSACAGFRSSTRDGETLCAHGASGRAGQPCHQRRGRAAHRAAEDPCAARFLRADAGEIQQQDQRRDAAALDGAEQSAPGAAAHRAARARAGFTTWKSCAGWSRWSTIRSFAQEWRAIKHHNKLRLAAYIHDRLGIAVDPESMFDVLVKRLHEYKRQHLQMLHILTLYKRIQRDPDVDIVPRTFIFGGKAAPGYRMAKLIIKLIHSVGEVINADPLVRDRLKVVFLPDLQREAGPARLSRRRPVASRSRWPAKKPPEPAT